MKQLAVFDKSFEQWLRAPLKELGVSVLPGRAGAFEAAVFPPSGGGPGPVRCRLAVLPGDWTPPFSLRAEETVTYGFSPRDTLTLSSAEGPLLSLQRELVTLDGRRLDPQELKFHRGFPVSGGALCAVAALLAAGFPVERVLSLSPRF